MTTDYIVASLPPLAFDSPVAITLEKFRELVGEDFKLPTKWYDLETQLKNAIAIARGGEKFLRDAKGCSIYWRNRIASCFQEKNPLARETLLDKVWWEAAEELTDLTNPLGKGAIATYAVRLQIAIKRSRISARDGNLAFDRLTAETKISTFNI